MGSCGPFSWWLQAWSNAPERQQGSGHLGVEVANEDPLLERIYRQLGLLARLLGSLELGHGVPERARPALRRALHERLMQVDEVGQLYDGRLGLRLNLGGQRGGPFGQLVQLGIWIPSRGSGDCISSLHRF